MKNITLLAIDIAKINFQLHGVDLYGKVVLRMKLTRNKLIEYIVSFLQIGITSKLIKDKIRILSCKNIRLFKKYLLVFPTKVMALY